MLCMVDAFILLKIKCKRPLFQLKVNFALNSFDGCILTQTNYLTRVCEIISVGGAWLAHFVTHDAICGAVMVNRNSVRVELACMDTAHELSPAGQSPPQKLRYSLHAHRSLLPMKMHPFS